MTKYINYNERTPPKVRSKVTIIEAKLVDKPKPLADLSSNCCRYPHGDPRKDGFGFCGLPVLKGRAYCETHAKACYTTPMENKRADEA